MKKILTSHAKVRFQDCDPFNHLNNGRYADYFINAREDQLLENYDLDIVKHTKETGKGWVVTSSQTQFLKPALLHEKVLLKSSLVHFSSKSLHVEMTMWDEAESELKAVSWMKFLYVDVLRQKATDHDEEFTRFLEQIVLPIQETTFEERCQIFRRTPMLRAA
jgi:acyl-CoA thioester hydrolase